MTPRHRHAVREWPVRQAHLPVPDARQPIEVWTERLENALFVPLVIAVLLMVVLLAPAGAR